MTSTKFASSAMEATSKTKTEKVCPRSNDSRDTISQHSSNSITTFEGCSPLEVKIVEELNEDQPCSIDKSNDKSLSERRGQTGQSMIDTPFTDNLEENDVHLDSDDDQNESGRSVDNNEEMLKEEFRALYRKYYEACNENILLHTALAEIQTNVYVQEEALSDARQELEKTSREIEKITEAVKDEKLQCLNLENDMPNLPTDELSKAEMKESTETYIEERQSLENERTEYMQSLLQCCKKEAGLSPEEKAGIDGLSSKEDFLKNLYRLTLASDNDTRSSEDISSAMCKELKILLSKQTKQSS